MKAEELKQEFIKHYAPRRELTDNSQAYFRFIRKLDEYVDEASREEVLKWHKAIADFLGEINKQIESKQKQK